MPDRWQRIKINKSFSSWSALLQEVIQESVLGSILFNIYLSDLLYVLCYDVCNFVDLTPYIYSKNLDFVLTKLEEHSIMAMEWFENNYMKINSDKCHLFISENNFKHSWAKIGIIEYRKIEQSNS